VQGAIVDEAERPERMLRKVERVRVFDQAVEQLRGAILSGQYQPSSRLPTEQELCELLDVSRSSIREALRVLEAEGLIEVRRGSGAFVTEVLNHLATRGEILGWLAKREESMIQILEVREGIEWLTASLAAERRTDGFVKGLQGIVDAQRAQAKNNDEGEENIIALADLDVQFHIAISEASGNDIAHEIVGHILPAFSEANRAVLWAGKNTALSINEHQAIVDAIALGDRTKAEDAMRSHISRVRQEICDYLNEACAE
jgi:GntR family transcriptional repressor for pyruvate dehydrogenase complex